ncbi:MAG: hypothetical protein H0W61_08025 [Bacteroidetes bacterium]|nr:hypothetical protein [Bacteroidota bacterium]
MSKDLEDNNPLNEPGNFGLPEGYFQKSAGSILNKFEWLEEHKEFIKLSELKKETGFVIPENYFEKKEIQFELLSYPALSKLSKQNAFTVPHDYFEDLEVNELAKVLSDVGTETDLPILNSIPKQNSFIVSEGYFKTSEEKIISLVQPSARVIKLFSAKTRYSAAAAVIALTLGLWIYNNYFTPVVSKDCGTLACIDKTDLVKTKNLERLDDEQLYEIVDTKKLEEKLENKSTEKNNKDADTSLKNISTEELLDEI